MGRKPRAEKDPKVMLVPVSPDRLGFLTADHLVNIARQMRAATVIHETPKRGDGRVKWNRDTLKTLRALERTFDVALAEFDGQSGVLDGVKPEPEEV